MSIYVMTLGDLAKKRGEPVGDFIKKVNTLGFEAGSHAKKLTQQDLDKLALLLSPAKTNEDSSTGKTAKVESSPITYENPNVILVNLPDGKIKVLSVNVTIDDSQNIVVNTIESSIEPTIGEALLEFRKQMGLRMGIN